MFSIKKIEKESIVDDTARQWYSSWGIHCKFNLKTSLYCIKPAVNIRVLFILN